MPVRRAVCGELHAKVVRQDRVILYELGKWRPVGLRETGLHSSLNVMAVETGSAFRVLREKKRAPASATGGRTVFVRIASWKSWAILWFIRRLSQSAVT
jgi:hypothetical protein